ncbi:MAG TPA: DUF1176 domain-containing protein [Sphingomicrobium sp.]|nr:DUF1176 domain-containing protein [Sphingomicrobium sp.]
MLALLLAVAASAQTLPPAPRGFGDWMVGCDNRRDCQAVGFADPSEPSGVDPDAPPFIGIIVSRKAEVQAEPSIEIDQRFFELDDYSGDIIADGKKTAFGFDKSGDLVGDARQFVRVLAASSTVVVRGPRGDTLGAFRTRGASAALRWMDDRQLRGGTVTAIVAAGTSPPSAVPPPPPLPKIALPPISSKPPRQLTAAQIAAARKPFDLCDEPRGRVEYYRIDAAHSIAIVDCWSGPYQSDGIIVLVPDRGQPRLAPLEAATEEELKGPAHERSRLISPDYDPDRRLLFMNYRGRGLNDCGANGSWAWDGTAFRLASYGALNECRGVTARLPYWQTANDPSAHE